MVAYRSYLTKDEIRERFGEDAADKIELKKQHTKESEGQSAEDDKQSTWLKAKYGKFGIKINAKLFGTAKVMTKY